MKVIDIDRPYTVWDMNKVKSLREAFVGQMAFIKSMLPAAEWDSPKQVLDYFQNVLEITVENVKIAHLSEVLHQLDHDSFEYDVLNGYIMYLKLKWSVQNYLDCIIRHEINGRVNLRLHQGKWVLPNKRPLSGSPEIIECMTHSEGVAV